MTGLAFEESRVRLAHSPDRERPYAGHKRTYVRQLGYALLVRIDRPGNRYAAVACPIGIYIDHSECHPSEEIAAAVFRAYGERFHSLHIYDYLPGELVLPDALLIQCLAVALYNQPYTGVAALVIPGSGDERDFLKALVQPERGVSHSLAHQGLIDREGKS